MEKKESKADKIRAYFTANPDARPDKAVEDLGVNLQYAYAIKKEMRGGKPKRRYTKKTPTDGQLVLRSVLTKKDEEIQTLRAELFTATAIIRYLESRMEHRRGAAV